MLSDWSTWSLSMAQAELPATWVARAKQVLDGYQNIAPQNTPLWQRKFPHVKEIFICKGVSYQEESYFQGKLIYITRQPLFTRHFFPSSSQHLSPLPRSLTPLFLCLAEDGIKASVIPMTLSLSFQFFLNSPAYVCMYLNLFFFPC